MPYSIGQNEEATEESHEEEEVEVKDEDKLMAEVHPRKGIYISPFLH